MVLLGLLWIRLLWKIGTNQSENDNENNTDITTKSLFQLESVDAQRCQNLGSIDEIDITLVTQLSDDRLWMMEYHCERYGPHAMSIAVYSNATRKHIVDELVGMGCNIDGTQKTSGARVSIQVLGARTHGAWNNYPVNELRNLALKGVKTTHITYIDVDFWPSKGLYEAILSRPIRQALWEDPKLALVIPAFQLKRKKDCRDETIDCRDEHVPRMPTTTDQLKQMVIDRSAEVFDPTNRGGHGSTDYQHWFTYQTSGDDENLLHELPCLKSHRYEPFVTIRYCKEITPPFQQAFSGYGKNKMTWMMQVVASGFKFSQVAGAYLIHYPHAISKSRQDWNKAPKELVDGNENDKNYNVRRVKPSDGNLGFEKYHRGRVDELYIQFKEWLQKSIPASEARLGMCEDAQDDDSKLWIDPERKQWKE